MAPVTLFYSTYSNAACPPLNTYKGGRTYHEVDQKVWTPAANLWSLLFTDFYHDTR